MYAYAMNDYMCLYLRKSVCDARVFFDVMQNWVDWFSFD